jgi:Fur family transcriptional regulator, ferric uptake regulator
MVLHIQSGNYGTEAELHMMMSTSEVIAQVQARGERLTIQRRLVIETLCAAGEHLAVQEIQQRLVVGGCEISETTVYRIVQWLKDLQLVSQTDLGQNGVVYQIIGDHPHHHLVCLNCGHVIDVDDDLLAPLRAMLRRDYDFEPRIDHMAIFGVCGACREAPDT